MMAKTQQLIHLQTLGRHILLEPIIHQKRTHGKELANRRLDDLDFLHKNHLAEVCWCLFEKFLETSYV